MGNVGVIKIEDPLFKANNSYIITIKLNSALNRSFIIYVEKSEMEMWNAQPSDGDSVSDLLRIIKNII